MGYRIQYVGAGKVRIAKVHLSGAEFAKVVLNKKTDRFETEYVPGYAGLTFDRGVWEQFVGDKSASQVTIAHPGWTSTDFEAFLANQSSCP
jgi:hypothetical protein